MVKVIVVDDEYLAREGMKKTIDWTKYGCILCGEAEDGYEGIELAQKVKPDLVITDIKMPGIDGIDMAKKIKEYLPNCKFIIITGYDELEYAKGAIKINAFDFLLKPIDEDELIGIIKKASIECNKIKENMCLTREKKLLNIMRGNVAGRENIAAALSQIGINDADNNIIVFLFQNENCDKYNNNEVIGGIIKKYFPDKSFLVECHEYRIALIASADVIKNRDDIYTILKNIKDETRQKEVVLTVGISNINSIYNLKKAYEESKESLKYIMYAGKGSTIYFNDFMKEKFIEWQSILEKEKEIIIKLKACDKAGVEKQLKKLYLLFKRNNIDDNIIKQTSINLVLRCVDILYEYNVVPEKAFGESFNVYKNIEKLETINEIYIFVQKVLNIIIHYIREGSISISENGMETALKYINDHLYENISLSDVSKAVFLNESYLSRKIKKMLGISFVEYITKLRMDKAIECFKDPNVKINDVAHELGYQDYRYFSRIFKKYTGYFPSEWKKNRIDN